MTPSRSAVRQALDPSDPRILDILYLFVRFRLLQAPHIVGLLFGILDHDSYRRWYDKIKRLLKTLSDSEHGLIRSVHPPRRSAGGSIPIPYELTVKGGRVLLDHRLADDALLDILVPRRRPRIKANTNFVPHELGIADVIVAIEMSCRSHPSISFISQEDILRRTLQEHDRSRDKALSWSVEVPNGKQTALGNDEYSPIGMEPDYVFGIQFRHYPQSVNTQDFVFEFDRGEMPIYRHSLNPSSLHRKYLGYTHTPATLYEDQFGMSRQPVVLTATSTKTHVANIQRYIDRTASDRVASRLQTSYFIDTDTFLAHLSSSSSVWTGNVLDIPWQDGAGRTGNPFAMPVLHNPRVFLQTLADYAHEDTQRGGERSLQLAVEYQEQEHTSRVTLSATARIGDLALSFERGLGHLTDHSEVRMSSSKASTATGRNTKTLETLVQAIAELQTGGQALGFTPELYFPPLPIPEACFLDQTMVPELSQT